MEKAELVTVTYNAEKNLSFFLPSLINNKDNLSKIYFVDNASSDNTINELNNFIKEESRFLPSKIISNSKNYGYAHAINIGIKKALEENSEYIFVTNNDIIFNGGFFAQMLKDATDNQLDALGVPASINEHNLGLGYNLDPFTSEPKKEPPMKRENINEEVSKNPLRAVDFPHGGTILFSRNFFIKIGLYDPNLFFGGDELDFLYRVTTYNSSHDDKIKCAVSLKSFLMIDNLTKHNSGHKIIKAKGMLQGNARVNLKHKFTPLQVGLYWEQYRLIRNLSKGQIIRYVALYLFALRGLTIEIYKYYFSKS